MKLRRTKKICHFGSLCI